MSSCIVNIESDEIFDDYRYANYKYLIFKSFGPDITIEQDFRLGKGGILWDASYILSKFLNTFDLKEKKILELGAGTALPSVVAAISGGEVYCTDIYPALTLAKASINLNNELCGSQVSCIELDWTERDHRSRIPIRSFDFILLSDVFYLPELADDFLDTLRHFTSEESIVLICYKHRIDSIVVPYIERLRNHFEFTYHEEFLKSIHKGEDLYLVSARKINNN